MEDYTIIQGQTMLEVLCALLLTLVTSYVYLSCKTHAGRANAANAKPEVGSRSVLRRTRLPAAQSPSSPASVLWKKQTVLKTLNKSSIADWVAPVVVWGAVSWTMLAVVIILLGDN